ncbi:hypothetical protein QJQ45_012874 [Haematococcus lacustris]|nr:hypothetical protein QJQ45_012874 [Haematococcus lacustris]
MGCAAGLVQAPHLVTSAWQQWQPPLPTSGTSSPGLPCTLLPQDSQPHCPSTACLAPDASAVCGKRRREQHAPPISQDCIERPRSSSGLSNTSKETDMQHAADPHLSALCAEQAQLIKRLQDEKQLLVSHSMALSARLAALEGPAACTGTGYPAPSGSLAMCAPAWQATPSTASQHPCTGLLPSASCATSSRSSPSAGTSGTPASPPLPGDWHVQWHQPARSKHAGMHQPVPHASPTRSCHCNRWMHARALLMPVQGHQPQGRCMPAMQLLLARPTLAWSGPSCAHNSWRQGCAGHCQRDLQQSAPALLHQAPAPDPHTAVSHQARVAMQHAHVVGPMPQDGLMAQLAAQMEVARAALQHLRCTRSQE